MSLRQPKAASLLAASPRASGFIDSLSFSSSPPARGCRRCDVHEWLAPGRAAEAAEAMIASGNGGYSPVVTMASRASREGSPIKSNAYRRSSALFCAMFQVAPAKALIMLLSRLSGFARDGLVDVFYGCGRVPGEVTDRVPTQIPFSGQYVDRPQYTIASRPRGRTSVPRRRDDGGRLASRSGQGQADYRARCWQGLRHVGRN